MTFKDVFPDAEAREIDREAMTGLFNARNKNSNPFGFLDRADPDPDLEKFQLHHFLKCYELWSAKMEREKIGSFIEYDEKYQVLIPAIDWFAHLEE